jgi:hypothetical protein
MAIKMSMKCTRCHREDILELETLAEATALEEHQKRKAVVLKKLKDFVGSLPAEDLPDFFAVLGDKVLIHDYLCDPQDDSKRSCASRVSDLLAGVNELGERKPRTKKEKEKEKEKEKTPQAA